MPAHAASWRHAFPSIVAPCHRLAANFTDLHKMDLYLLDPTVEVRCVGITPTTQCTPCHHATAFSCGFTWAIVEVVWGFPDRNDPHTCEDRLDCVPLPQCFFSWYLGGCWQRGVQETYAAVVRTAGGGSRERGQGRGDTVPLGHSGSAGALSRLHRPHCTRCQSGVHVTGWGVVAVCVCTPQEALLGEISPLFPDQYFHIGGDESNFQSVMHPGVIRGFVSRGADLRLAEVLAGRDRCWYQVPHIQQFMTEHGLDAYALMAVRVRCAFRSIVGVITCISLHQAMGVGGLLSTAFVIQTFTQRVLAIAERVAPGKKLVVWQVRSVIPPPFPVGDLCDG